MYTKLITLNELNETMDVVFTDIAKIKYNETRNNKAHSGEYYALVHDLTDGKYIVLDIVRSNIVKVETQETKTDIDEWNHNVMNNITGKKYSLVENIITALDDLTQTVSTNDFSDSSYLEEDIFTMEDYDSLDIKEKSDLFVSHLINEHITPNTPEVIEELILEISKKLDKLNELTSKPEPNKLFMLFQH